jgi:hypothetical protein
MKSNVIMNHLELFLTSMCVACASELRYIEVKLQKDTGTCPSLFFTVHVTYA